MPETANINNPDLFESYKLYFRTRSRSSGNYLELVKRTAREPNIIYPDRWFDMDIDRVITGSSCVHFGCQEFKHVDKLSNPFTWNTGQSEWVRNKLVDSNFQIENFTTNFTSLGIKGVRLPDGINVIPGCDYKEFLKELRRAQVRQNRAGKGVFLFVFYTENLEYFSPVNFTGSKYVFGNGGYELRGDEITLDSPNYFKLKYHLGDVGKLIEPCFNEFLLFLLEGYIRQDFNTLYEYFSGGEENDLLRFSQNWEKEITKEFVDRANKVCRWDAFCHVMEWILGCIHFDTIIENPAQYQNFVDLVKNGKIVDEMRRMFDVKYSENISSYEKVVQACG